VPSTVQAYSLNITVVPTGALNHLTAWATAQTQPTTVSTLNSLDGRVIANAAIVPAGSGGAISIYVSDQTDVIIDIDGYFAPPGPGGLVFVPVPPCRAVSTVISAGASPSFALSKAGNCPDLSSAVAYSLNVTAIPPQQEYLYLTIWPTPTMPGPPPIISTLNSTDGAGISNTALVPAGSGGAVEVYVYSQATVDIDVNGYFAPQGTAGGELLYLLQPCRVADTRSGFGFSGSFGPPSLGAGSTRSFPMPSSLCNIPSSAQDYSLNLTVIPSQPLGSLTAWPAGQAPPTTLNLTSTLQKVVADAALVGAGSQGAISVLPTGSTDLVIDVNGYFAQPPSQPTITGNLGNAMWYLGGVLSDNGYYAFQTLTASQSCSNCATWSWSSTGTGSVSLSCQTNCPSSITVTSVSPSSYCTPGSPTNDVMVYVTIGGLQSPGFPLTVVKPAATTQLTGGIGFDQAQSNGYVSPYTWNLTDSCGGSDFGLDWYEQFGTWATEYTGTDWPHPSASSSAPPKGAPNPSSVFEDDIGNLGVNSGTIPPPEPPQQPLTMVMVFDDTPWQLFVGSYTPLQGVSVHSDRQQWYQDHGRHCPVPPGDCSNQ